MLSAIIIAVIQQLTFLSYLSESVFFTRSTSEEMHALMIGVAWFSALLSIPSFVWNLIMVKEVNDKKDIISLIVSSSTFVFGLGFLIFAFAFRIHAQGGRVF